MTQPTFKTRFRMRVIIYGEPLKVIKSHDFSYILKVEDDYKSKYTPDQIEFRIVESKVLKTRKPRYKEFSNLPEWVEHYGINADNEYYASNEDYTRIVRLKEVKE